MFSIILACGVISAQNVVDTLQWIENVDTTINNAVLMEVDPTIWNNEWCVDEWQRVEYMPQAGSYSYYHKPNEKVLVQNNGNQGTITVEGYSLNLIDLTHNIIEISRQRVNNIYGSQDYIFGELVLLDGLLYYHICIIGTQDYAVDLYGRGQATNNSVKDIGSERRVTTCKFFRSGQLMIQTPIGIFSTTGKLIEY